MTSRFCLAVHLVKDEFALTAYSAQSAYLAYQKDGIRGALQEDALRTVFMIAHRIKMADYFVRGKIPPRYDREENTKS